MEPISFFLPNFFFQDYCMKSDQQEEFDLRLRFELII